MTLRLKLAGSVALIALTQALSVAPSFAQTAPATQPSGADSATASGSGAENIVVTGSRLKTSNATSETPVVVVTSAQIEHSSAQTLEDVLQKLPEIGTNGIYSTTNNGGAGDSCVELRNLGIERTLVLVDGKRFIEGSASCVDLNNIPLGQVERIEILKDGASTTYGADAIAGVINIILKHNYSGVQFHANGSIATDAGDDKEGELSVLAGQNFDKGNFTLGFDYDNRGPVFQKDRDWAAEPVQTDNPLGSGPQTVGSGYVPNGRFLPDANNINPNYPAAGYLYPNADGTTLGSHNRFDFGQLQQLSDSLEKESITSTANYDFNDHITGYMEGFYTHKRTQEQLAPQPVAGSLPGSGLPDAFVIPDGNPYLATLLGPGSGPVDLFKRPTQFGNRQYTQTDNTFQINIGARGDLGAGWDYDVFFQYGEDDDQTLNSSNINFLHLENEVGFQQTTATSAQEAAIVAVNGAFDPLTFGIYNPNVCVASAGCVLANPFGQQFSNAAVKYATYTEATQTRYTLKTYGGTVSNNELFHLPAGGLGVSLGVEHRSETGEFTPDSLDLTGEGLGSTARATKGGFDVTELYGEVKIPILKDVPFAKDLHVDVGGRFFNYSSSGADTIWKVSGNYTPVTGIRFRGSDGTAFRQPSINDLFTGQLISFNGATDPCAQVSSYGSKSGTVQANCVKSGVANTATFQQNGTQVQAIEGGNPALQPETARTQTVGVVLTPSFIPRFAATADFSRTRINSSISTLNPQYILDQCYTSSSDFVPGGSSGPCSLVSQRAGTGQLNTITQINENLGVLRTEALDVGTTYSYPTANFGTFSFQNDLTLTLKYQQQSVKDGPFIGYLGTIAAEQPSFPAYPRIRNNLSLDWRLGNISLGYRMRFIQGTVFDTYPGPFVQGSGPTDSASAKTPDIFYHDIVGSYDWKNFSFIVGVDNLFDKAPPYVFDGATNTDAAVYDVFGRVVYMKTALRF